MLPWVDAHRAALEALPRAAVLLVMLPPYMVAADGLASWTSRMLYGDVSAAPILFTLLGYGSMVFFLLGIAAVNPVLLSLSIALLAAFNPSILAGYPVNLVVGFSALSLGSVVLASYRRGQLRHIRPGINFSTALILPLALMLVLAASAFLSGVFDGIVEGLRGASIPNPRLEPLRELLAYNPIGILALVALYLGFVYHAVSLAGEAASMYALPSRSHAIASLKPRGLGFPLVPPLQSLRGLLASLVISPPIYYLAWRAIEGWDLLGGGLSALEQAILRWLAASLILGAVWLVVGGAIVRVDAEPGPLRLLGLLSVVGLLYGLAALAGYWSPEEGFPGLGYLDESLAGVVTSYYRALIPVVDLLPALLGVAP